jgi:hypothetical protein
VPVDDEIADANFKFCRACEFKPDVFFWSALNVWLVGLSNFDWTIRLAYSSGKIIYLRLLDLHNLWKFIVYWLVGRTVIKGTEEF